LDITCFDLLVETALCAGRHYRVWEKANTFNHTIWNFFVFVFDSTLDVVITSTWRKKERFASKTEECKKRISQSLARPDKAPESFCTNLAITQATFELDFNAPEVLLIELNVVHFNSAARSKRQV
jgi:hypothetical protein